MEKDICIDCPYKIECALLNDNPINGKRYVEALHIDETRRDKCIQQQRNGNIFGLCC